MKISAAPIYDHLKPQKVAKRLEFARKFNVHHGAKVEAFSNNKGDYVIKQTVIAPNRKRVVSTSFDHSGNIKKEVHSDQEGNIIERTILDFTDHCLGKKAKKIDKKITINPENFEITKKVNNKTQSIKQHSRNLIALA